MSLSPAEEFALLPLDEQMAWLARLPPEEAEALMRDWRFHARPEQLAPEGAWQVWLVLGGRGAGKGRSGAEFVLDRVLDPRPTVGRLIALVSRTAADCRDVQVEGEAGVMACAEQRKVKARYEPTKRRVTFVGLDARATTFSAEEPESLRGPQHDTGWADEGAAWKRIVDKEGNTAYTNLRLGMRIGVDPKLAVTTTPKPVPLIKELVGDAKDPDKPVVLSSMTMFDNVAHLSSDWVRDMLNRYSGTRLGAQELEGRLLDTVEGALWRPDMIDPYRIEVVQGGEVVLPMLRQTVVAIDPAFSDADTADEAGIVVVSIDAHRERPEVYVRADLSGRMTATGWARAGVAAYHRYRASALVVESNLGGPQHMTNIVRMADPSVRVVPVRAAEGKQPRAAPVAALYEQGRVHHVGSFPELESEQMTWVLGEKSPNRMDALVHGIGYLMPAAIRRPARATSGARAAAGYARR